MPSIHMLVLTALLTLPCTISNRGFSVGRFTPLLNRYADGFASDSFTPGTLLAVLNEEGSRIILGDDPSMFPEANVLEVENLSSANDKLFMPDGFRRIVALHLASDSPEDTVRSLGVLKNNPYIDSIEYNFSYSLCGVVPNDTYFGSQWAAGRIDLPEAWNISTGNSAIRIGVVDSGIYASHLDLSPNVLTSYGGCFDSVYSNAYEDVCEHGTHVAGIIAAKGNNNRGVAGVCWDAALISYRISNSLTSATSVSLYGAASAVNQAMLDGVEFLNMSFAGTYTNALYTAISNYNGLAICAAGNESANIDTNPVYPASYNLDNIITVGNSTQADLPRDSSNYGSANVDLFAPGTAIYSTGVGNNDYYVNMTGTSMAAPFVTGTAALIRAANPAISIQNIKQNILSGTDYNGSFLNKCVTSGRLNTYQAVLKSLPNHSSSEGHFGSIATLNPGKSQWYSITVPFGYHSVSSSSGITINGALYADPDSTPLVSGTLGSGISSWLSSGTYYLKVTNQSYYPGTYTINIS